jgi:hypothetical protein
LTGARPAAALALSLACACVSLPEIAHDDCGNGVIEAHEDCDGFAPLAGSVCRPKGSVGECHLDCRVPATGPQPACPSGWGCDLDGICRPPTGEFEDLGTTEVGGVASLLAGDFDGDGRTDILSRGPQGTLGLTKVRFHYFDERGKLAESRSFPKLLAAPSIIDLEGEGRRGLVFSNGHVGVLPGRADRAWVPRSYGSYRIPGAAARLVSVHDQAIEGITSGIMALTTLNGVPGLYPPDGTTGQLRLRARLDGPVDSLVGDPVAGALIEDPASSPCRELVLAVAGATTFQVLDTCTRSDKGEVIWRTEFQRRSVALEPPAPIDAAPQIVDVDRDGHLDVMVGAGGRIYLARGDGAGLEVARPYQIAAANAEALAQLAGIDPAALGMPLVVGEFSGDRFPDFVFPGFLLVSRPTPGSALPSYAAAGNVNGRWTTARIVDLNGNGLPDVVAASSSGLDIDFFNGTGTDQLTAFSIPTSGPVRAMDAQDLDGDLINDLAFVEAAVSGPDKVLIAFGTPAGPPSAPAAVALLNGIEQLSAFREGQLGTLTASSRDTGGQRHDGVITLFEGGGDRIPLAPYRLTNFSADGSIGDSPAFGLAAGRFSGRTRGEVLALGTGDPVFQSDWRFWFLPVLEAASASTRLDPPLGLRFHPFSPVAVGNQPPEPRATLASAVADLDRDGRDESVWAVPADDQAHCGLMVVGTNATVPVSLVAGDTVILDQPCPAPQLLAVDADGDGWIDLVMLAGAPGDPRRALMVLWNEHGHFTATRVTVIAGVASAQGFAPLALPPDGRFALATVTDTALLLTSSTGPRQFGAPRTLAAVSHGSGVVAADVNGDGALDLVVASSGDLQVMRARLAPP